MFAVNNLIFLIAFLAAVGICRSQEPQAKRGEEEITLEEAGYATAAGSVRAFSPPPLNFSTTERQKNCYLKSRQEILYFAFAAQKLCYRAYSNPNDYRVCKEKRVWADNILEIGEEKK